MALLKPACTDGSSGLMATKADCNVSVSPWQHTGFTCGAGAEAQGTYPEVTGTAFGEGLLAVEHLEREHEEELEVASRLELQQGFRIPRHDAVEEVDTVLCEVRVAVGICRAVSSRQRSGLATQILCFSRTW